LTASNIKAELAPMSSESHLTSKTVSLPHNLKDFVKAQSISAACSTQTE